MQFGLDLLGAAKYADLAFREFPEGWSLGVFANTFGDSRAIVKKLLGEDLGYKRAVDARVHLLWSDTHSFSEKSIREAEKEAHKWKTLSSEYKDRLLVSPWCEHNARRGLLDKLHEAIKSILPDCQYVNTPWKGDLLPGVLNEVHGSHAKPKGQYLYSFDGTSCVDADIEKFKKTHCNAERFYFWHPAFNGKLNVNDKTPRPKRKAWPTSELIDSIIYLHREIGDYGAPLSSKHIWKSHADRHETPPTSREYKPVFISPVDSKRIELVASNGQVVAVLPRKGNFTDGRPLYRADQYGYQLAEKARRIHGHPTVTVVANGKRVGYVNPAFRGGSFR